MTVSGNGPVAAVWLAVKERVAFPEPAGVICELTPAAVPETVKVGAPVPPPIIVVLIVTDDEPAGFPKPSELEFQPIQASPFNQGPGPAKVTLEQNQLQVLSTLYSIEDDIMSGLQKLDSLIHGSQISPQAFANALSDIGSALKELDDFDEGVNTVFCLFDQLVRQQTTAAEARVSSLDLKSTIPGQTQVVEKVLLSG